jgi:hypothetical protein
MPEATVLYAVVAVVVSGLVVWVVAVLLKAKEPWGRAAPGEPTDPDTTAKATPVALGNTKPEHPKDEGAGA